MANVKTFSFKVFYHNGDLAKVFTGLSRVALIRYRNWYHNLPEVSATVTTEEE
jgi:hypothetical protein